jgi:glycosyltransferase involved in cell wall biosynthesis
MITYFYRNRKVGFSIAKVANIITNLIKDKEIFEVPSYRAKPISILRNLIYIRKHCNKDGINHIVGDIHYGILALIGCKSILTIHDASSYDRANNKIKKIITKYLCYVWPLKYADQIICISQSTKQSIQRFTKRTDIQVIYNSISPEYHYCEKEFNSERPRVLILGTASNKNIERTIQALNAVKCYVSIIGKLNNEQIQLLKSNKIDYCNKVNLTDYEVMEEYIQCDIVCFCSLYEGFGMPIIEANAIGRVVIASKIPSIIEIGNNSVFYVDPYKIDEIRNGISILINDQKLRSELIQNGLMNIKKFSPENILSKYLDVYNNMNN